MFFLRLTLYTCAFYFAIALPVIIAELAAEFWKNGSFLLWPGWSCYVCGILGNRLACIVCAGISSYFSRSMGKARWLEGPNV